jgi:ABC-type nickel/cobalt efflux system permease component RcnA
MTGRLPLGLLALVLLAAAGLWALSAGTVDLGAAWTRLIAWIIATQRELHAALATAMRAVQAEGGIAAPALVWLGFLYGVFHAAGPGHGKIVITTYLATQKETLGRGIALAVTAAMVQGLTAILAVFGTVTILEQTARQSRILADRIELLSFALVACLGAFLTFRHGRNLWQARTTTPCGTCGHHHHAPPPTKAFMASILSIGMRPCAGAILVLVLAIALDLRLAGIAAVIAMSLGTALTTAAMASLAVFARDQASRLASRLDTDANRLARLADTIALLGGLALLAMGTALLHATLTMPAHPLMRG